MINENYIHPTSPVMDEVLRSDDPELIVSGPYQSGKSFPLMVRLHLIHLDSPIFSLVVRKTKESLYSSVIPQFETKILDASPLGANKILKAHGGKGVKWYDYFNGGRMVVGGLDEPTRLLSSEYDYIFFNQCEEGTVNEWESLLSRCTGRSGRWLDRHGNPLHQVVGDCNPDGPGHWIKRRESQGNLRLIETTHKDNATLFYNGEWTDLGRTTRDTLKRSLTGLRYERGFLGKWVAAENQVYEYEPKRHLIHEMPEGWENWLKYRAINFGFKDAFVCLWFVLSPQGVLICYREYRKSLERVEVHAEAIKRLSGAERYAFTVADHESEDYETLLRSKVSAVPARKTILPELGAVKKRLKEGTLLFYDKALVEVDWNLRNEDLEIDTVEEFPMYHYQPQDKRTGDSSKDDIPVPEHDRGMVALQHMVGRLDLAMPAFRYSSRSVNYAR